jgi:hypothetical protein
MAREENCVMLDRPDDLAAATKTFVTGAAR